jgi:hypothetical protein
MRDDKMHPSIYFLVSNVHMMLLSTTFLAKPMFKVNKPLLISKQTMDVTWQNIPWLVRELSTMLQNIL